MRRGGGGEDGSKYTCGLTSTETVRLIRDGGKGEGGMEVGGEEYYIPIATLSPPEMTPALMRWAVMRAILMFR